MYLLTEKKRKINESENELRNNFVPLVKGQKRGSWRELKLGK